MKRPVNLSVNLNKIALLRNSRRTGVPELREFAEFARTAGCSGLTVHPRPDRRHITSDDVAELSAWMRPWRPSLELNIEGYPDERFFEIVRAVTPEQCTLVPDPPDALTSDTGWCFDAAQLKVLERCLPLISPLCGRIILFIDPIPELAETAATIGVDGIEIYTGGFAAEQRAGMATDQLAAVSATAKAARAKGLIVNVGHDLNLSNLPVLLKCTPDIAEASIGHELTIDAMRMGFGPAVAAYRACLAGSFQ